MALGDLSAILSNWQQQEAERKREAKLGEVDWTNIIPWVTKSIIEKNPVSAVLGTTGELARALSRSNKDVAGGMQELSSIMPTMSQLGKATTGENPITSFMRNYNFTRPVTPRERDAQTKIEAYKKDPKFKQSLSIDPYTGKEQLGFTDVSLEQENQRIAQKRLDAYMAALGNREKQIQLGANEKDLYNRLILAYPSLNQAIQALYAPDENSPIKNEQEIKKRESSGNDFIDAIPIIGGTLGESLKGPKIEPKRRTMLESYNAAGLNMPAVLSALGKYYSGMGRGLNTPSKEFSLPNLIEDTQ